MRHVKTISVAKASTNPDPGSAVLGIGVWLWGIVFFVKEWLDG